MLPASFPPWPQLSVDRGKFWETGTLEKVLLRSKSDTISTQNSLGRIQYSIEVENTNQTDPVSNCVWLSTHIVQGTSGEETERRIQYAEYLRSQHTFYTPKCWFTQATYQLITLMGSCEIMLTYTLLSS